MRKTNLNFLNILTATSLSFMPLAYADEPILAKCLSIKDSKNRLNCYDKSAPETIKQFAQLHNPITTPSTNQNEENATALKEQQLLVKDTLKEIKKLNTATKIGISKVEYSRRVLDVASNIQPNLEEIKNISIQNQLKVALQAYVDANDFWEQMYNLEYISSFFERYAKQVGKYGVTSSDYDDYNGTFRRLGMSQILTPVWAFAATAIEQAELEAAKK